MERETGIEPATNSLEGCDSTTELLPPTLTLASLAAPAAKPDGYSAPHTPAAKPAVAPLSTHCGGPGRGRAPLFAHSGG